MEVSLAEKYAHPINTYNMNMRLVGSMGAGLILVNFVNAEGVISSNEGRRGQMAHYLPTLRHQDTRVLL
jgi:hypothetical protein